jgi:hypothetical protein
MEKISLFEFWDPDAVLKQFPNAKTFAEYELEVAAKGMHGQRGGRGKEEVKEEVKEEIKEAVGKAEVREEEEELSESGPELLSPFLDSWALGSDPTSNRSPSRPQGHVRGRARPHKLEIDTQFDVFDFEGQQLQREALGAAQALQLAPHAIPVKGRRGKRLANEGDVFDAQDIRRKRDAVLKKHEAKKQAAARKKAAKVREKVETQKLNLSSKWQP